MIIRLKRNWLILNVDHEKFLVTIVNSRSLMASFHVFRRLFNFVVIILIAKTFEFQFKIIVSASHFKHLLSPELAEVVHLRSFMMTVSCFRYLKFNASHHFNRRSILHMGTVMHFDHNLNLSLPMIMK